MPLEDPNSIDVILKAEDGNGKIILCIIDAGVTKDPAKRLELLMQKFRNYLGHIVGGGFAQEYPNHRPEDFIFRVVCSRPPTPEMERISRIRPSGDQSNAVSVEYEEYPKGAWSEPEPPDDEQIPAGASASEEDEDEDKLSTPVQRAGKHGMILASLALMQGRKNFLFVAFPSDEGIKTVYISEDSASEDSMDHADKYARELPSFVPCCVVVADADDFPIEGKKQCAVLLLTYERGQKDGMLYAMPFRRKGRLLGYKQLAPPQFMAPTPNPMWDGKSS